VARGYRPVDRDQQFLLPPDMREWLPDGHIVWVLIDAVGLLDTSALHARCRTGGVGRAGYDPDMMLTLLFYAYARGVRSSRRIERLCWEDVGFRVICAQDVPDHTTVWRFADMAPDLVAGLFTQVLQLCARAGMVRLDTITLDGMKIAANASGRANRTGEQISAELARLADTVVAEHLAIDAAEHTDDHDAGQLPPGDMGDPRARRVRLARALAEIEAAIAAEQTQQAERDASGQDYLGRMRQGPVVGGPPRNAAVEAAQVRLDQAIAVQQAKGAAWQARNADKTARTGRGLTGLPPRPVEEHFAVIRARASLAKAQASQARRQAKAADKPALVRNTTDPHSRLMPTRTGFIQGYNPQNLASADLFIIASELTQDTGDVGQAVPMMAAAEHAAQTIAAARPPSSLHSNTIGVMIMDAGYLSEDNLTTPGPDRLIATGKRRDVETAARTGPDQPTDPLTATDRMAQRLRTPEAMATYRQRGHIAETPHGHIKHNMAIRALTRRGLHRASAEWKLITTTYNLNRLLATLARTNQPLPTS
jgi:transposase